MVTLPGEVTLDGLALLARQEHLLAGLAQVQIRQVQRLLALLLFLFEEMAEGAHLGRLRGGTTIAESVEPLAARVGEFHLGLAQACGRFLSLLDGAAIAFQRRLLGTLAEGENSLEFEFEPFHGFDNLGG